MSMLTPPELGGEYRITGDRYPRMRRRRGRHRIVLGSLAAVTALGLASWGTLELISVFSGNSTPLAAAHAAGCAPTPTASAGARDAEPVAVAKVAEPKAVTVNVLNATTRTGLAQDTADVLKKRGFTIGAVDNAPPELDGKVKATGLLIGTEQAEKDGAFALLSAHVAKADTRTDAVRAGDAATSVDLVLGDAFNGLAEPKAAAKALTALTEPAPEPSQTGC
ncbi:MULTISPECIES: LytR C-terminal domain-containing protein [unclassified Streptomyces]|uniref:LytR C-terminal domain-containing protein n=1 Tax=unclassified Streptomyces TaxID=2593676 RepID=UPI0022B668B8|nr:MULTISPECIES: LytR C-terminal domain-containing protein [unclassified Streptomyces]MCZ7417528.1 LytR C-terminal domain-containing protein [Streptomyces sp. WMMC897]MCZ7432643.1 LytR C-terminal domain-containing protein [Streptomyces sp. WMMC1477]